MDPTLELACELIRRRSVTPDDAGCQDLLADRLDAAGFVVERLPFGDVRNLWAVAGRSGPLLCFAGHTDVVPAGPLDDWSGDPFEPRLQGGLLYGRGAADMKGSLAAMTTAAERFRSAHGDHSGRLAFLLTSDEEGLAADGTRRVVETLTQRGERIDWCLVGEPTSAKRLGDTIKNGRRGSLTGRMTVRGRQGHVAYPQTADNAVHRLLPVLTGLIGLDWRGEDAAAEAHFPPTSLQVTDLHAGTGADNVIPGRAEIRFNLRYSTAWTAAQIQARIENLCRDHGLAATFDWHHSGEPFLTPSGELVAAVGDAVRAVTSLSPALSTAGGTSDGRFIAPTEAQVVEFGPVNATIHQADEHVAGDDLTTLSKVYESIIKRLLSRASSA